VGLCWVRQGDASELECVNVRLDAEGSSISCEGTRVCRLYPAKPTPFCVPGRRRFLVHTARTLYSFTAHILIPRPHPPPCPGRIRTPPAAGPSHRRSARLAATHRRAAAAWRTGIGPTAPAMPAGGRQRPGGRCGGRGGAGEGRTRVVRRRGWMRRWRGSWCISGEGLACSPRRGRPYQVHPRHRDGASALR
jgi:hypothetical protein